MKSHILFILSSFLSVASTGQAKYSIVFNKPTTMRVNSEQSINDINTYSVDFLNTAGQVVKHIGRTAHEDHHAKMGYRQEDYIAYPFYTDSLVMFTIGIDLTDRILHKTVYTYQDGKEISWESYGTKPKISRDSFQYIVSNDVFLNFPERFPTRNLLLDSKLERKYENRRIVYKRYYERYGKLKTAELQWERTYKYDNNGQLIEYAATPFGPIGGTTSWKYGFTYNDSGKLVRQEIYRDGKHWGTDEFEYKEDTIIETQKRHNTAADKGLPTTTTRVYKLHSDGSYYTGRYRAKLNMPNYAE